MEKITNLKKLKLSPKVNPLIESSTPIKTKNGLVVTKMGNDLLDPETGEQHTHALIHTIKTIDDANFVKVFAEGVKKAFELNRTEMRVFQKVLEIYEKEKMTGGYADSITLCWFDDGLNGEKIGMSDRMMGARCEYLYTLFHWFLNECVSTEFVQFDYDISLLQLPIHTRHKLLAQCQGAYFSNAQYQEVGFTNAQCQGADFWMAQFQKVNFISAQCQGAHFDLVNFQRVNFINAQCQGAHFWINLFF
jgi:hypothetical protein